MRLATVQRWAALAAMMIAGLWMIAGPAAAQTFRPRSSFSSDSDYAAYLKGYLHTGDRVTAIQAIDGKITAGMSGTFHGSSPTGNAFVRWDGITPNGCFYASQGGAPAVNDSHGWCVPYSIIAPTYTPVAARPFYRPRSSFSSDDAYGAFLQTYLRNGDRVTAIQARDGKITFGMRGTFHGSSPTGNAFVRWDGVTPNGCFYPSQGGAPASNDQHGWCVPYFVIAPETSPVFTPTTSPTTASGGFRPRSSFSSDAAYGDYLKTYLHTGDAVTAIQAIDGKITVGMRGTFHGSSPSGNAFVRWEGVTPNGCFYASQGGAPAFNDSRGWCVPYSIIAPASVSTSFRPRSSFSSDSDYGAYVRGYLKPGYRVYATKTYEKVPAGSVGTYYGTSTGTPPAFVRWDNITPAGCFYSGMGGAPAANDSHGYCVYFDALAPLSARPAYIPTPTPSPTYVPPVVPTYKPSSSTSDTSEACRLYPNLC